MAFPAEEAHPPRVLPPGRRWGFGARSVVPYLAVALQSRPGRDEQASAPADAGISNPVFLHMEHTLRLLRQRH